MRYNSTSNSQRIPSDRQRAEVMPVFVSFQYCCFLSCFCPRCAGSAIHLRVLGFQTATHWCRESYSNSYERGGKNLLYKLGLNLTKEDSKPIFQQRHFTFNLHKSFMALPAILGQLRDKLRDRVVRQVRTGCCCTVLN